MHACYYSGMTIKDYMDFGNAVHRFGDLKHDLYSSEDNSKDGSDEDGDGEVDGE